MKMELSDLRVLYEDNHLIAVNKPANVPVQPDETEDITLADIVKQYIKIRYQKPGDVFLGTIHRIDRPVSGVVLFARTDKALKRMNELFATRQVQKTYLAVVMKRPEDLEAELRHFLLKDNQKNIVHAYDKQRYKDAKEAVLSYKLLGQIGQHHLVEVKPETGRPHQIRVQLSRISSPIKGDVKYGAKEPNVGKHIHLHSYKLSFIHPVKQEPVNIIALPSEKDNIWREFKHLIAE